MNNFISNYANTQNPITKFFNKFDDVKLCRYESQNIEWLEAMKKVPLYVKRISIYPNDAEELENLTDPNLHNTPIINLLLQLESFKFSSKTIENLKTIHPNSITLYSDPFDSDETKNQVYFGNFTKLLSNLDQNSLEMGVDWMYAYLNLEFSDVILKIVESNEDYSYIRAKSVEIRCKDKEYCWIK